MHLGLLSSYSKTISVTPSNVANLPSGFESRGIYVAVTGTVKYTNKEGVESIATLSAGIIHPIAAVKIFATGTTATGIEAHA